MNLIWFTCQLSSLTIYNTAFVFPVQSPEYQATIRFLTTKLIVQLLRTEFVQMLFTLLAVISGSTWVLCLHLFPAALFCSFLCPQCQVIKAFTTHFLLYFVFFGTVSDNKAISSFLVFGERNRPVAIITFHQWLKIGLRPRAYGSAVSWLSWKSSDGVLVVNPITSRVQAQSVQQLVMSHREIQSLRSV